jgi:[ribosomal protein S18]-alanine N-acetyltransferase
MSEVEETSHLRVQGLRIRFMEGRDIPSVVSLDRQVFRDPWPESAYVQEIYFNPAAHYFVLEQTDPMQARTWTTHRRRQAARLVGFVGMRVEGTRGHISTLAVHAAWRGLGLGELLLLVAVDQAIRDGAHVIGLEVRVSNDVAQRLYTKWHFSQHSRLRRYYANGEDAYLMQVEVADNTAYRCRVEERLSSLLDNLGIKAMDRDG